MAGRLQHQRRTFVLSICLLALCFSSVRAQVEIQPRVLSPVVAGMSPTRLARIDSTIQGYIDRKEAAGAVALICRKGAVVYRKTWGDQDRENGIPMRDDSIFRIYSMSKPITSVALMMLYEEGHFRLDDPVSSFLPEFADMQVQTETTDPDTGEVSVVTRPARRRITVRDLLRHTAGLTYGVFGNTQVDQAYREAGVLTDDKDLQDMVSKLGKIPLRFEPGTHWHYSLSVDVAGRLVEVISGMPFDQFLKQRLFDPLEMHDTGFVVAEDKRDRFTVLYAPKGTKADREAFLREQPKTKEIEPLEQGELSSYGEATTFFSGGGGMVSTADDYLRFCQMLLNKGAWGVSEDGTVQRILSRKTVELMTADHLHGITGYKTPGEAFGLGFGILQNVAERGRLGTEGTFDWGGAAGTKFWIDPQEELIGIFMVQIIPHRTRMGTQFRHLVYQAIAD